MSARGATLITTQPRHHSLHRSVAHMLPTPGDPTHSGNVEGLRVREALQIATQGGAKALGWEGEVGVIAPGYAADFVGWKVGGLWGGRGATTHSGQEMATGWMAAYCHALTGVIG